MQKSGLSSRINDSDCRRAPLATFDTVDLGEEDILQFSAARNKLLKHENFSASDSGLNCHNICNNEENLISGSNSSSEELDNISWKLSDRYMSSGYHQVKNSGTPKDTDEEVASLSVESVSQLSSNSDTDSSDSDAGYVKSGYISVKDGKVTKHDLSAVTFRPVEPSSPSKLRTDSQNNSSDHIDHCPPKSPLPVLIQELEKEKSISKRKALEKRIQRLQVTTNPVDRPRSTTPINVVTLEEYRDISSPERSPPESSEKIKIKLPGSEFHHKPKSPWRSRGTFGPKETEVFNFDEEQLFTRTKSALLVQNDGTPGNSPKRILIPPNLSPSLTPSASPLRTAIGASPKLQQKFIYIPGSPSLAHGEEKQSKLDGGWAAFEDSFPGKEKKNLDLQTTKVSEDLKSVTKDNQEGISSNENSSWVAQIAKGSMCANITTNGSFSRISELLKADNDDDVLTIAITENGGNRVCDIKVSQSEDNKTATADNVKSSLATHETESKTNFECESSDRLTETKKDDRIETNSTHNPQENELHSADQTLPDAVTSYHS